MSRKVIGAVLFAASLLAAGIPAHADVNVVTSLPGAKFLGSNAYGPVPIYVLKSRPVYFINIDPQDPHNMVSDNFKLCGRRVKYICPLFSFEVRTVTDGPIVVPGIAALKVGKDYRFHCSLHAMFGVLRIVSA